MPVLFEKNINGNSIFIEAVRIEDIIQREFNGQKILHPFKLVPVSEDKPNSMKYDDNITEEIKHILNTYTIEDDINIFFTYNIDEKSYY